MNEQLARRFADLPEFLGGHMLLSMAAMAVGLGVSIPLGILASRRPRLAEVSLTIAGVIQTIPTLALLALMVPLLGGMIGFVPAFIALTLYSILPILANTIIGIRGVDPVLTEAARGLGMSDRQMLFRVELPLAAPVIIAGIRTATVWTVGTATLATPVGETTLGNYIFQGLESRNHLATVFGCVFAALLAVVLDQLIHLLELAARRRSPSLAWIGAIGLVLVLAGGLWTPISQAITSRNNPDSAIVIGSGPFTEQYILSDVLTHQIRSAGFEVKQNKGVGETIQFDALFEDKMDCCVEYSGNVWSLVLKRTDVKDRQTVLDETTAYLREHHGVVCLGSLGFEDAYALAMTRRKAEELGIHTVGDLARQNRRWVIGGDNQFFGRPEWAMIQDTYGLKNVATKPMDPALMYTAVDEGSVDVISAYTSDGRIKALDLVILQDEKKVFPPYDAVLLISPAASRKPGFVEALKPLVGSINLEMMQEANKQVDQDGREPSAAAQWLEEKITKRR